MINIEAGRSDVLDQRVGFTDLEHLLEIQDGDLVSIGSLSYVYLLGNLASKDLPRIDLAGKGLESQIPFAPISEMGISLYKNMFQRGFKNAKKLIEGTQHV